MTRPSCPSLQLQSFGSNPRLPSDRDVDVDHKHFFSPSARLGLSAHVLATKAHGDPDRENHVSTGGESTDEFAAIQYGSGWQQKDKGETRTGATEKRMMVQVWTCVRAAPGRIGRLKRIESRRSSRHRGREAGSRPWPRSFESSYPKRPLKSPRSQSGAVSVCRPTRAGRYCPRPAPSLPPTPCSSASARKDAN